MQKKTKSTDRIRFIFRILPFILALVVFFTTRLAIKNPQFVEAYYSTGIYPYIAACISWFSRLFPFSLWDIYWSVIVILLLAGIIMTVFRKMRPGMFFLRFFQAIAIMYIFLYISWAYNYFRPEIQSRLGWDSRKPTEAEFRSVLDSIIFRANSTYIESDSTGYSEIDSLAELSFSKNADLLHMKYPGGTRRTKHMIYSTLMAWSGMSGYFGPFFNEVHLNKRLLAMDFPFSLAHEKAHQFGFARESEANLAGYIACDRSGDKRLQYSANIMMLIYFINDASVFKDYHSYVAKIDRRVYNDLIFRRTYYMSLQNKTLDKVHSAANDVYLKANNIPAGELNYNQVVALIISYLRETTVK